ncbi:MAG: hypothetical protein JNM94_14980 [Phycisphaerae bacterium]|nr:hypothetical protein [Phycisphaerae bacterium]
MASTIALAVSASSALHAQTLDVVWTGGDGVWSNASLWDPQVVPSNLGPFTFHAFIDASPRPSTVTLDLTPTLSGLTITSGDTVRLIDGHDLTFIGTSMTIDGELRIEVPPLQFSQLYFTEDCTLNGSGSISMGSHIFSGIAGDAGNRLTIGSDISILGRGSALSMAHDNFGLISAVEGSTTISTGTALNTNRGEIRATGLGVELKLNGVQIDNTNGLLDALDGGCICSSGENSIIGGTFGSSASSSELRTTYGTLTLDSVHAVGPVRVGRGSNLVLAGLINFDLPIVVGGTGSTSSAALAFTSTATFPYPTTIELLPPSPQGGSFPSVLRQSPSLDPPFLLIPETVDVFGEGTVTLKNCEFLGSIRSTTGNGIHLGGTSLKIGGSVIAETAPLRFSAGTIDAQGALISFDAANPIIWSSVSSATRILSNATFSARDDSPIILGKSWTYEDIACATGIEVVATSTLKGSIHSPGLHMQPTEDYNVDVTTSSVSFPLATTITITENVDWFADSLVIDDDDSLSGAGMFDAEVLTNEGIIESGGGGTLTLFVGGTLTNNSVIQGVDGTLLLKGQGSLDNSNGVLTALPGGTLKSLSDEGSNVLIKGGELRNDGGIVDLTSVQLDNVTVGNGVSLNLARVKGSLFIRPEETLKAGTLYAVSPGSTLKPLLPGTTAVLQSTGGFVSAESTGAVFTIESGIIAHILGGVTTNTAPLVLINHGSLLLESASGAGQANIKQAATGSFTNKGLFALVSANCEADGGSVANEGFLWIGPGLQFKRAGTPYKQIAGETKLLGTMFVIGSQCQVIGGEFTGTGSITGPLVNTSGRVAPGDDEGTGFGTLSSSTYTQSADGTLEIEVGGSVAGTFDVVKATTTATLAGTLEIRLRDGFIPPAGTSLTVVSGTSRVGTFDTIDSCVPVTMQYTPTTAKIVFGNVPIAGDFDGDGVVGPSDLGVLLGSWGLCVDSCCAEDLDADGEVGPADLGILLGSWDA